MAAEEYYCTCIIFSIVPVADPHSAAKACATLRPTEIALNTEKAYMYINLLSYVSALNKIGQNSL